MTAQPAERTPHRHAGPLRALAEVEGQHLQLQAKTLIDRYDAMTGGAISAAGPMQLDEIVTELLNWAADALNVLREVAR